MEGWISLHRKMVTWEWYNDPNTLRLFLHCLLKANHTDKKWRGIDIERGSFVTSYGKLSKELELSVQNIRTSIANLKLTGELTSKSTSKNTVIKVVNYGLHQTANKQTNKQVTSNQQASNKQVTTTNNDNNDNNDNKLKIEASQIKNFKAKILSEVQQKNIIAKAQSDVIKRGGKWACDYDFNPYDVLGRQFTNYNKICVDGKWSFNDLNHIKNSFYSFVVEYWEFQYDAIVSKMKTKYKKKYTKKW